MSAKQAINDKLQSQIKKGLLLSLSLKKIIEIGEYCIVQVVLAV